MTEINQENQNLETLEKIKVIFDAIQKIVNRLVVLIFIVLISYLVYHLIDKYFDISIFYKSLLEKVGKPVGLWTSIGVIFLIGILLSVFKSKQQFWYGIFETAFALASCYFTVKSIKETSDVLTILVALGSTIYLIVRGLSNISDGVKKAFWLKSELLTISSSFKSVTNKSLINALKDKEVLVDIISTTLDFIIKFI
jgi:hypothetical protein